MIPVQIKRLHPEAQIPTYATAGAAGLDLRAMIERPTWLQPGQTMMVPTGIAIHLADPSYVAKIYPRSGLGAKHGIVLGNLIGVIDSDYQGEIMCCLWNRGDMAYEVQPGERIAQLLIEYVERANFIEVEHFAASERGEGGFGSTGAN